MATIAVFIALGGGAYAATQLQRNSVGSAQIIDGKVRSVDVKDNGLTGRDVKEASLRKVPNADKLDNRDSSAYQTTGSEGWTPLTLTPANNPPNFCRWENVEGENADASYYRDRDGTVHLRGVVKAVDGAVFNCGAIEGDEVIAISGLPPGYRPDVQMGFTTSANKAPGQVNICPALFCVPAPNGSIFIEKDYPNFMHAKVGVALDGISFRCGPSGENGCP